MDDTTKFNFVPRILNNEELKFTLSGRDTALQLAAQCFKEITRPPTETSKIDRKVPVCSGLSGLGKTRMLEEWERIFELADIPKSRLGILIPYYNGHMPQSVEKEMTIEASFSWRLLHRWFIEGTNIYCTTISKN